MLAEGSDCDAEEEERRRPLPFSVSVEAEKWPPPPHKTAATWLLISVKGDASSWSPDENEEAARPAQHSTSLSCAAKYPWPVMPDPLPWKALL